VLTIRVEDKFGDMGRVGSAIIKHHEKNVEIDTFLLSCRALGRKVERSFLYEIIKFCEYKGVKEVTCSYEKTSRNMQTEFFYDDNDFTCLSSNNEGKKYSMPIINIGINPIDFISIDNTNIYENR
jgi:FkbH-like protein